MKHIHLDSCPSTFTVLEDNYHGSSLLVSCDKQTDGKGRRGSRWDGFKHSLAFSFATHPHSQITITALEAGVLICEFFHNTYDKKVQLKWPNDLLYMNKKVGGILIKSFKNYIAIGVGLNIKMDEHESFPDYRVPGGAIFAPDFAFSKQKLSFSLASYIENNRIVDAEIIRRLFHRHCSHINQAVELFNGEDCRGKFIGINNEGAALIDTSSEIRTVYNASLKLII